MSISGLTPNEQRWLRFARSTAAVLLLCLAGCATPTREWHLYEGDPLPEDERAVLEFAYPVEVLSVDGHKLDSARLHPATKPRRLYLEPGPCVIVARHGVIYLLDEEDRPIVRPAPVRIETELEAGAHYRLMYRIGPPQEGVDIWVEEID